MPRPSSTTACELRRSGVGRSRKCRRSPTRRSSTAARWPPVQRRNPESQVVVRFYLTTAIDYVNSRPHLATAYEKITADVIARYKRLAGADTYFLMGNDEHSQNVYKRAVEQGLGNRP